MLRDPGALLGNLTESKAEEAKLFQTEVPGLPRKPWQSWGPPRPCLEVAPALYVTMLVVQGHTH